MKHSVFTVCMPEYTVDEAVDKLAAWGYEGVEWRMTTPRPSPDGKPGFWAGNRCTLPFDEALEKAEGLGRRCRDTGLEIPDLASYVKCDQPAADVERALEAAVRMGARQVRIGVPDYDGKTHYRKLFDKSRREYAEVETLARRAGVRAVIEIHMGNICPSVSAGFRFVADLDPKHVGIIHDAGNMIIEGFENWRLGLELLGDYLAMVHVKNARWVPAATGAFGQTTYERQWAELREGQVNWAEVIAALKAVGYDGWLSIEDFSTARTTGEKLPDALAWLRRLESEA